MRRVRGVTGGGGGRERGRGKGEGRGRVCALSDSVVYVTQV